MSSDWMCIHVCLWVLHPIPFSNVSESLRNQEGKWQNSEWTEREVKSRVLAVRVRRMELIDFGFYGIDYFDAAWRIHTAVFLSLHM